MPDKNLENNLFSIDPVPEDESFQDLDDDLEDNQWEENSLDFPESMVASTINEESPTEGVIDNEFFIEAQTEIPHNNAQEKAMTSNSPITSLPLDNRVFLSGSQQKLPNSRELEVGQKQQAFAQKISQRNFFDAMAMIVGELSHLEIMTIVEDEDDPYFEGDLSDYRGLPGQRMITRIGLIDGDIQNFIGSRFIESASYQDLNQFHREQVEQSHQIIKNNLEALKNAINYLEGLTNQD